METSNLQQHTPDGLLLAAASNSRLAIRSADAWRAAGESFDRGNPQRCLALLDAIDPAHLAAAGVPSSLVEAAHAANKAVASCEAQRLGHPTGLLSRATRRLALQRSEGLLRATCEAADAVHPHTFEALYLSALINVAALTEDPHAAASVLETGIVVWARRAPANPLSPPSDPLRSEAGGGTSSRFRCVLTHLRHALAASVPLPHGATGNDDDVTTTATTTATASATAVNTATASCSATGPTPRHGLDSSAVPTHVRVVWALSVAWMRCGFWFEAVLALRDLEGTLAFWEHQILRGAVHALHGRRTAMQTARARTGYLCAVAQLGGCCPERSRVSDTDGVDRGIDSRATVGNGKAGSHERRGEQYEGDERDTHQARHIQHTRQAALAGAVTTLRACCALEA